MAFRRCTTASFCWICSRVTIATMRQSKGFPGHSLKDRKYRRFDLHFPVTLSLLGGETARELSGVTQNVSVGGLLINLGDEAPLHSRVSVKMSVAGPKSRRPVLLHGEGRVVRVDSLGPQAGFAIAVECSRCIREMRHHLPGAAQ
jgi:PilZ domain